MAGNAEQLAIDLEARVTKLEAGMGKAQAIANKAYAQMKRSSGSATRQMEADMRRSTSRINQMLASSSTKIGAYGKAFVGGLVGGIAAGGIAGVARQIGDVAQSIAEIGDKAKMAGLSAKAFQELGYVAKANRIEVDALTDGMKELSLRADEYLATGKGSAAESFQRLGISAEELKKKLADPSALFTEIIGKLSQLDKAAQIRISDELFGGTGGEKFVQLIAQGEEGIRATIQEAHNLGLVMDDEVIERAQELDRKFTAVANTVGTALKTAIVEAAAELQKFIDQFHAFDQRATGTLKDRFSELQTRYGQLVKQQGTTEDKLLSYIGKDAAAEIEAVKAEMDQIATELRKRATPMLREKLVAQNTANTPYTPPPTKPKPIKKTADDRFAEDIQAVRDRVTAMKEEQAALGLSFEAQQKRTISLELEQEALRQVREEARKKGDKDWQNAQLSPAQVKAIDEVSDAYARQADELRKAQEAMDLQRDVLKGAFSDFRSALDDGKLDWQDFANIAMNALDKIIDKIENDLIDAIMEANSAGGGGGILGGLFSLLGGGSSSGGSIPWSEDIFRAGGGPVKAGQPYIVGEKRPELFVPSSNGTIVPRVPSTVQQSSGPISVTLSPVITVSHDGEGNAGEQVTAALNKFKKEMTPMVVKSLREAKTRGLI